MLWERRSWVPFVILSVFILSVIGIIIFRTYSPKQSQFPQEPLQGCVVMQDRGDYEDTIDIVFLGDNYDTLEEFIVDTKSFKESLLSVEPYIKYADRFNFFRIEQFQPLDCTYDEVILCNPSTVKQVGKICPHDYFVVLSDVEGVKNLFKFLRSSSWLGINSLNTADNKLVLAHEFAHIFGDFADEYEFDGDITWDAPNCDPEWRTCPKFSVVNGSECWRGCVNDKYSRSIKVGLMRDYWSSDIYGIYNEYVLTKLINENTNQITDNNIKRSPPYNILLVFGECDDGICSITNVEEDVGYFDSYNVNSYLSVISGEEEASLASPRLFSDYGSNGKSEDVSNFNFLIIVKEDPSTKKVNLIDSGGEVIDSYIYSPSQRDRLFGIPKRVGLF